MDIKKNDIMAKSATSKGNVSHRSLITSPKEEKKTASWHEHRKRGGYFIESGKERGYILTEKMKELEIMVEYDMDHVLDVEEVPRFTRILWTSFSRACTLNSSFHSPQPVSTIQ